MQPSFLPIRSLAANTVFYRSLRTDPFLKDIFHRDYSTGGSQPLRSLTGIVYIPIPSYGFVSIGRFLRIRSHIWIVSTDFLVPISLLGSCLPILLQQSFSTDPISHLDRLYRFLYTDFFARIVSTDLTSAVVFYRSDPIPHLDRFYRFLCTDFLARIVSTDLTATQSFSIDPIHHDRFYRLLCTLTLSDMPHSAEA